MRIRFIAESANRDGVRLVGGFAGLPDRRFSWDDLTGGRGFVAGLNRPDRGIRFIAESANRDGVRAKTEIQKPTAAPKPKFKAKKVADGVITLSDLCAELKHDPKPARAKLRAAAKDAKACPALAKSHAPRKSWEWERGSAALAEARKAISS
jgi:hypothetical protein